MFGRKPDEGQWIATWPKATVGAAVVAVLLWFASAAVLYQRHWTALQRYYLPAYVGSAVMGALDLPATSYTFVEATDRRGSRLAGNGDVRSSELFGGGNGLTPTPDAERRGVRVVVPKTSANALHHAGVNDLLRRTFYRGRSPFRLMDAAWWISGSSLAALLLFAVPADYRRLRDRRRGRRIRGPELLTVGAFNAAHSG